MMRCVALFLWLSAAIIQRSSAQPQCERLKNTLTYTQKDAPRDLTKVVRFYFFLSVDHGCGMALWRRCRSGLTAMLFAFIAGLCGCFESCYLIGGYYASLKLLALPIMTNYIFACFAMSFLNRLICYAILIIFPSLHCRFLW